MIWGLFHDILQTPAAIEVILEAYFFFVNTIDIISSYGFNWGYKQEYVSRPEEKILGALRSHNFITFNKMITVSLESKFCFNNSLETS